MIALIVGGLLALAAACLYVRADSARARTHRACERELAAERQRSFEQLREIYTAADARQAELVSQLLYAVGRSWDTPPAFRREVEATAPTPRQRTVTEAAYIDDAESLIESAFGE